MEVDRGDAVADKRHLHTLCLPVGQRVLVACDINSVREVFAAQFDVDGVGLFADIAHQVLGTENDVVVQGLCEAGHEAVVMAVAGEGVYGCDGVFGEVRLVFENCADTLPARFPLVAPEIRAAVNLARHRRIDEAGILAVLELVVLNVRGQSVLVVGAVGRNGDVVVEEVVGNHRVEHERRAQRMADAEGASRRAIVGFYVWHQLILDEFLQVGRFAVVVALLEQPSVAMQGHGQVVVVAKIVDVPKGW